MLNQFTPENTALVLIGDQVGTVQLIKTMSSDESVRKAAKALALPVVLATGQEDHDNIRPEAYKNRIKRSGIVNTWADPKFTEAVQATGRKNLIMGGVEGDLCLIFPGMSAVQEGYSVLAVIDAFGSSYDFQEEMSRAWRKRACAHDDEHDHRRAGAGLAHQGGLGTRQASGDDRAD